MIPYGKQQIDQTDIDAVIEVLNSDWLTQGPKVPEFEKSVASYCNAQYAIAVNSATSALHLACLALEVGNGDIVWTSPISFVASSNCALYCGASIDFIDIDIATGNICVENLREKLIEASNTGSLPKVVITVHLAGQSCDMAEIYTLSLEFGFKIIEDASHAIGGSYKNIKVGSCRYSDITIFSFHPVKIVTSAEGGMALTNDQAIARKIQMLRSHGVTNEESEMTEPSHGVWYYQQQYLGFNYRMTDIQAALGNNQFNKVDPFVSKRNQLAKNYDSAFENTNVIPLKQSIDVYSAYHLYVIRVPDLTVPQHKTVLESLRKSGVMCHLHYIPIYLQPYYQTLGFKKGYCKNAEEYYRTAMTLPLYPALSNEEQAFVIESTLKVLNDFIN